MTLPNPYTILNLISEHLHPYAVRDIAAEIERGELDSGDKVAVFDRAIAAHESYTGVTISLEF